MAELLAERGRAFASCGMWLEARVPMEAALEALPPERVEERARVLIDLSDVCFLGDGCCEPPSSSLAR